MRILSVDAPAVAHEGQLEERCAANATALIEELTSAGDSVIVPDPAEPETDCYGRTLAYVEVDGV